MRRLLKDTPFRVFQSAYVGAVVDARRRVAAPPYPDGWQEWAKQRGHRGLAYVLIGDGTLSGPVAKNLSDAERDGLAAHVGGANPGTAYSSRRLSSKLTGPPGCGPR